MHKRRNLEAAEQLDLPGIKEVAKVQISLLKQSGFAFAKLEEPHQKDLKVTFAEMQKREQRKNLERRMAEVEKNIKGEPVDPEQHIKIVAAALAEFFWEKDKTRAKSLVSGDFLQAAESAVRQALAITHLTPFGKRYVLPKGREAEFAEDKFELFKVNKHAEVTFTEFGETVIFVLENGYFAKDHIKSQIGVAAWQTINQVKKVMRQAN